MKKLLLLVFSILLFFSCNSSKEQSEVKVIHIDVDTFEGFGFVDLFGQ